MNDIDEGYDESVQALGKLIDQHVLEEREQIFLKALNAPVDLRGIVPALFFRKKQLQGAVKLTALSKHRGAS